MMSSLSHLVKQAAVGSVRLELFCRNLSSSARSSMRILQFMQSEERFIGVRVDKEHIAKLSPSFSTDVCTALANHGQERLLAEAARCLQSGDKIELSQVTLLPPVTNPDKVLCVGLNYRDHCKEVGLPLPAEPVLFSKFSSCITTSGDIPIPSVTKCIDWECELVAVIGKKAKNVKEADALDYVLGYTAANDVSARDMLGSKEQPRNGGQFLTAKALDNFCPLSFDIVTKDEILDVDNIPLSTSVNGEVRQNSNTKEMIFNVPNLIAYASSIFTLLPGDIILTGTPSGVGFGRKPPLFVKSGDVVEVAIEGVGKVVNRFL
ncbi:oxaloacetate tautomerase fahd2, mitochondrial-like [Watersipora subatra]|uniref:oxaloacetate tautomerase fahd2, mitochondrial-like n=1 Tax=Watersipora subatra TaxID=2589382 RepID=UPI00355BCF6C